MSPAKRAKGPHEPSFLKDIQNYYTDKIKAHGANAAGVDWGSTERQERRFQMLAKPLVGAKDFSILDLGCGYGAYWDYLSAAHKHFDYTGADLSDEMIQTARATHPQLSATCFQTGGIPDKMFDFVAASGIFNIMGGTGTDIWSTYVHDTLKAMFAHCRIACSCNFLTSYSDVDKKKAGLYYADPKDIIDFCVRELSIDIDFSHHYDAWDFTVHIFKTRPN